MDVFWKIFDLLLSVGVVVFAFLYGFECGRGKELERQLNRELDNVLEGKTSTTGVEQEE